MDTPSREPNQEPASKIQHSQTQLGEPAVVASTPQDTSPLPVYQSDGPTVSESKISAFGGKPKRHEDIWSRTPNTTGKGAIHTKTFHCKLTADALLYLDQSINEWLDAHPQYEVKFVSSTVGTISGKLKEPNLICQVWV